MIARDESDLVVSRLERGAETKRMLAEEGHRDQFSVAKDWWQVRIESFSAIAMGATCGWTQHSTAVRQTPTTHHRHLHHHTLLPVSLALTSSIVRILHPC
jgi:hypothetical protein